MRHPGTESLLKWLTPNPNLPVAVLGIASDCQRLAVEIVNAISDDSPELTAGLRKLLEAKDCFVRAAIESA